jgi:hypothetical protein
MGWEFCSQLVGQLRCNVRAVAIALGYPEKRVGAKALRVEGEKLRPSFC